MSPLKPEATTQQAERWALEVFAISGSASPLPGYTDRNFLLDCGDDGRWVLKVAHAANHRQDVECQVEVLRFLASTPVAEYVPALCATRDGELSAQVETTTDGRCFIRLVSYLEGTPMVEIGDPGPQLRTDTGRLLGLLDRHLVDFDHPGVHRHLDWDVVNFLELDPFRGFLDLEMAPIIEQVFGLFRRQVVPHLESLRRSVIHSDANDHNLLVSVVGGTPRLCGLIDFGDLIHSITVADPANAAAYAMLAAEDPEAAAEELLVAYEDVFPLTDLERELVPLLSLARLSTSVLMAAKARSTSPDDAYLQVTDQPAQRVLKRLL